MAVPASVLGTERVPPYAHMLWTWLHVQASSDRELTEYQLLFPLQEQGFFTLGLSGNKNPISILLHCAYFF